MKQVAGTLRLELAQYREMAAFAQFGSDLDQTTQRQLNRGARLVELLKQGQYEPLPVEKQILIIYAGTNGFVDELPLTALKKYEQELYSFTESKHPDILADILKKRELDNDLRSKMSKALEEFKGIFKH
jgi:F-type H+-transporting ATPase subunit alpha